MGSGKKKKLKAEKAKAREQNKQLKDHFQNNPGGGGNYAKKQVAKEAEHKKWLGTDEGRATVKIRKEEVRERKEEAAWEKRCEERNQRYPGY